MNSDINKTIDKNNSDKNEYLFWKIFHNKFLLNKILHYIQTIEWVQYHNHSQLHINNRLKLNDIHSLSFMILNKLYHLINYKLDNNHYIDIKCFSINYFFILLSCNKKDKELLKEILFKFLNKRRDEFETLDLTFQAASNNSIDALKILINEPYSIVIYPSTLKYAIKNSHPSIVEIILNANSNIYLGYNRNDDDDEDDDIILNNLFKFALKNSKFHSEMIDCIKLNYKLKTTTTPCLINNNNNNNNNNDNDNDNDYNSEHIKKKFKSNPSTLSSFSNSSSINRLSCEVLSKFESIMEEKNNEILDILSFENIVSIYNLLYNENESSSTTTTNTTTIINSNDLNLKMKQLETLIIIKLKDNQNLEEPFYIFYSDFVRKYKEIVVECHMDGDKYYNEIHLDDNVDQAIKQTILKFVQLFIILDAFEEQVFDKDEIFNDCINGSLLWNDLLLDIFFRNILKEGPVLINDRSTVEWMLNCKNESIKSFLYTILKKYHLQH